MNLQQPVWNSGNGESRLISPNLGKQRQLFVLCLPWKDSMLCQGDSITSLHYYFFFFLQWVESFFTRALRAPFESKPAQFISALSLITASRRSFSVQMFCSKVIPHTCSLCQCNQVTMELKVSGRDVICSWRPAEWRSSLTRSWTLPVLSLKTAKLTSPKCPRFCTVNSVRDWRSDFVQSYMFESNVFHTFD